MNLRLLLSASLLFAMPLSSALADDDDSIDPDSEPEGPVEDPPPTSDDPAPEAEPEPEPEPEKKRPRVIIKVGMVGDSGIGRTYSYSYSYDEPPAPPCLPELHGWIDGANAQNAVNQAGQSPLGPIFQDAVADALAEPGNPPAVPVWIAAATLDGLDTLDLALGDWSDLLVTPAVPPEATAALVVAFDDACGEAEFLPE